MTLPRLGTIRTHESTRKLARRLENGTARILSATVSRTAQRWFVSFCVEVERAIPERHARPGSAIGVDLGVKTLLTGVDDAGNVITVAGPKATSVVAAETSPGQPGALPQGAGQREPPQERGQAGPRPCPRGECPRRRAAQGDHATSRPGTRPSLRKT